MTQLFLFKLKRAALQAPERDTHIALADTLSRFAEPGWELWTHFPVGEYRTKTTAALLQRMGTKPGWSDFVFIGPDGRHYWLELKKGTAPLNAAQKAFRDACEARGVPWAVARSYREAIAILTAWGALKRVEVSA